jgi:hypothetical protein
MCSGLPVGGPLLYGLPAAVLRPWSRSQQSDASLKRLPLAPNNAWMGDTLWAAEGCGVNLEGLVQQHRLSLRPAAGALKACEAFDLGLPCAVLDAERGSVLTTVIGKMSKHLPTSYALASEPIERFLRLKDSVGFAAAFEAMSADDDYGDEFCRQWDEAMADLERGVLVSLNDLVAMVDQAKRGWEESPRRLLVVVLERQRVSSALVSTEVLEA